MNEIVSPGTEGNSFIPKNLSISNYPNVPSCSEDHFHEKREAKIPHGANSQLVSAQIGPLSPIDPKIVPDSLTEITGEEQV